MSETCCTKKINCKVSNGKTYTSGSKQDIFDSISDQIKGNVWLDALFGIEKENLRVDSHGNLAQTPHPKVFGNKLKHPYITTDFSESQVEMVTPPLPDIKQTLGFLETIHDIVSLELKDEYLWPQSIPSVLPDDTQIPIAKFDEESKDAEQYREMLAQKYGPKNQLFSGIHFNLSFSEKLLERLYSLSNSSLSYEEFKDEVYLKTTRQLLRFRWLYVLLYGFSPVVDSTMELKCKQAPNKIDRHVLGLSIRNSCYGYQNIGELYPDYSSVQNFRHSIDKMVYDGKISSARELYSSVRPKFIKSPDHISYIEIRFIDIDPLSKIGITEEALYFLHTHALYGLLSKEPDNFDASAQMRANEYHGYVALYGLNPGPVVYDKTGEAINVWERAEYQLNEIVNLFKRLNINNDEYTTALANVRKLIENPKQRKVFDILEGVLKVGYVPFHMEKAKTYLKESQLKNYNFKGLEDMELSTQLLLREAIKRGVDFEILDRKENFVRLKQNGNIQYVKQATKTSLDNYASILVMENKQVTKKILEEA
jgi:glutamate--cysteine ligase